MLSVSPELSSVVGSHNQTRVEIVNKLWAYIKKNKLQDIVEKRMINCDVTLRVIFGKERVSMFEIATLLCPHISIGRKYVPRNR